ncbi:MAG: L,D-transpeptidase family protein [Caulobacteraceae bacterium]|nr:L,D-transpeptidase family protein [Caulobacteraceae bacterium]
MNRARLAPTIGKRRDRLWPILGAAALTLAQVLALGGAAQAQPGAPASSAPPAPAPKPAPVITLRSDQIALLERALGQADRYGFDPVTFNPAGLDAQLDARDPQARRAGQAALVALTLRYAKAMRSGSLAPDDFLYEWGLKPAPYDPAPDFAQAVAQDRLAAWLDSLPPPYTGFDALRRGLAVYRGIAANGGWDTVDAGPDLKLAMTGKRVVQLRTRLAVEDAAVKAPGGPVFDQALADAVIRAQKRYGLEPTGVLDKSTLAALNVPVDERINQIIANMERWRWLPTVLPSDRIQVNIAAAILTVFHSDTPVLSMRAVTGRPGDETPMLQSQIQSIVLNPPWNVPSDIAAKELWPKERAHPGYFKRNDFIVIRTPDGGVRLQQKAGPKAALGHVKFDFVNKYGVYLHDTPTHGTFGRYARMVSHGCVRLEKPVPLANLVMQGSSEWTPEAIKTTIAGGDTVRAQLPKPIAVFLLYWTAYVGPDGEVNFRGDPYNWDHILVQKLTAPGHGGA